MFRWPNQESESLSVLKGLLVWVQTLEPGNVAQINRILYLDYIGDLRKFIILAYPGIVYIDVYWVYSILALFDCKKNITDGQICWILIISSPSSCGSSRFCSAVSIDRILHHQQRATDGYGFNYWPQRTIYVLSLTSRFVINFVGLLVPPVPQCIANVRHHANTSLAGSLDLIWLVNPPAPKVLGRDLPDGTRKRLQVYLGGAFFGQNLLFLIGRDARLQKTL